MFNKTISQPANAALFASAHMVSNICQGTAILCFLLLLPQVKHYRNLSSVSKLEKNIFGFKALE